MLVAVAMASCSNNTCPTESKCEPVVAPVADTVVEVVDSTVVETVAPAAQ